MEFENSLDLSAKRSIYAHFSEQHWAPIFCGIDQHLNRQSPFRRIAFRLREFPNIIPGISRCSSRPLTGQRHGLIKRTIPGHCILRKRRKPPGDSSLPGEDSFPRYDVASPFPWSGIVRIAGALRDRASVSFLLCQWVAAHFILESTRRTRESCGFGNSANQTGLLPNGLTPSVDGKPKVSRRCATEPGPRFWRLSSVASDISRTSSTVFRPAALSAFRTLVENRTFAMSVSSGSSGVG
jgi:hypothetical protein